MLAKNDACILSQTGQKKSRLGDCLVVQAIRKLSKLNRYGRLP